MKKLSNPILVSCLSAGLGLLCLPVRLWLMNAGIDNRDLVIGGHPGSILSWILTAVLVLLLAAAVIVKPEKYTFRPGLFSGAGAVVIALCLGLTAFFVLPKADTPLAVTFGVVSVLGALCGVFLAWFRFQNKRAWLPLYLPALFALMLQFLYRFQLWGAEPELQRYFFSLCAQVCILLTAFYRFGAECRTSAPVLYVLFSSASVFFGFAAVADPGVGYLYGLWAAGILAENLGIRVIRRKSHDAA